MLSRQWVRLSLLNTGMCSVTLGLSIQQPVRSQKQMSHAMCASPDVFWSSGFSSQEREAVLEITTSSWDDSSWPVA